jgi:hypothetical protein
LLRLASSPVPEGVRWLAITATLDVVVPGVRSVPAHADVETMKIDGVGHLGMLLSPRVVGSIVAALTANHQRRQCICNSLFHGLSDTCSAHFNLADESVSGRR